VWAQEPVWMLWAIALPNAPPGLLPAELADLLPVTSACSALSAHYVFVTTNSSINITIIAACINFWLVIWQYIINPGCVTHSIFHYLSLTATGIATTCWTTEESEFEYQQSQEHSFHHAVQTVSGAHKKTTYLLGTEGSFFEGKAAGAWSWPFTSS
jgi:hypothetical protein